MRTLRVVIAVCFFAGTARADSALRDAKAFYDGFEFQKCVDRLQPAPASDTAQEELAEREMYAGLCRFDLGRKEDARRHFRRAITLQPSLSLPPLTSPKIVAVFQQLKSQGPEEISAPSKAAEIPVPTPVPVPIDAPRKLTLSPKPTAAPSQPFQVASEKSPKLPVVPISLGAGAVAALATSIVFGLEAHRLQTDANNALFDNDNFRLGRAARTDATVANVGFAVAGGLAVSAALTWLLGNHG